MEGPSPILPLEPVEIVPLEPIDWPELTELPLLVEWPFDTLVDFVALSLVPVLTDSL